jgi:hypothetical protein
LSTDLRRVAILAIMAIAGCGAPPTSGPPASPRISCQGVPAERCDEAVASVELSLPNTTPTAIDVICVSGTCSPESGAMDTVVTLADGNQLRSTTFSWSEGASAPGGGVNKPVPVPEVPPAPAPAVIEPVCQGVPKSMCDTMAETAFGELSTEAVVSILVRCSEPPCTNEHGVGETLVSYADGTTGTSSWEYEG